MSENIAYILKPLAEEKGNRRYCGYCGKLEYIVWTGCIGLRSAKQAATSPGASVPLPEFCDCPIEEYRDENEIYDVSMEPSTDVRAT